MSSKSANIALLGVVLIWGINFLAMKVGVDQASPILFNAVRMTLSTAILLVWARFEPPASGTRPSWTTLFGLAVLGHVGYQILFVVGLEKTNVGNAALLISSSPIWAALVARLMGERLNPRGWLGLLMACIGTTVIAAARDDIQFDSESLQGDMMCIAAAMTWGTFSALSRPATQRIPPARFAGQTMLLSLPLLWLAAWIEGPRITYGFDLAWTVAYSGLFGTGIAYILFNFGLSRVGAAQATSYINLVPVVTLITGLLFLEDPIRPSQMIGGGLVIAGVWTLQRARIPKAPQP